MACMGCSSISTPQAAEPIQRPHGKHDADVSEGKTVSDTALSKPLSACDSRVGKGRDEGQYDVASRQPGPRAAGHSEEGRCEASLSSSLPGAAEMVFARRSRCEPQPQPLTPRGMPAARPLPARPKVAGVPALPLPLVDFASAALASLADGDEESGEEGEACGPSFGALSDRSRSPGPSPFPMDVEVSVPTRKVLFTWCRWARNSMRINEEQQLKALQHVRHPRTRPPAQPKEALSPQPTPRESSPRGGGDTSPPGGASPATPQGTRAFAGLTSERTVVSRGATPGRRGQDVEPKGSFIDSMREDQRQSMDQQGLKNKLCHKLGAGAAVAKSGISADTPGFGADTPSWGASRGGSVGASNSASVMSSGVASPSGENGGQMSPWLLEAEAFINGVGDFEDDPVSLGKDVIAAWGQSPSGLHVAPLAASAWDAPPFGLSELGVAGVATSTSVSLAPALGGGFGDLLGGDLEPILDRDELEEVALFAIATPEPSPAPTLAAAPAPALAPAPTSAAPPGHSGTAPTVPTGYAIGESVKYWSASRCVWMPAVVVERRARGVYLVDKQMRGCLSKVKACDLISEAEESSDPGLRAFASLGQDKPEPSRKANTAPPQLAPDPAPARGGRSPPAFRGAAGHADALRPQGSGVTLKVAQRGPPGSGRPTTPPSLRGRVVRDDFSDDSDE